MNEVDDTIPAISSASAPEIAGLGAPVAVTLLECRFARDIEAFEGESLMVALKRAGLPLLAVCGGKGACGTCKVAFRESWSKKLPEVGERELRLLTHIKASPEERLSCRIQLTATLGGLEVGS